MMLGFVIRGRGAKQAGIVFLAGVVLFGLGLLVSEI